MKTNYDIIEKMTYKYEITIEPLESNVWTIIFPECYDEENIKAFTLDLFLNGIKIKKNEDNILIYEE